MPHSDQQSTYDTLIYNKPPLSNHSFSNQSFSNQTSLIHTPPNFKTVKIPPTKYKVYRSWICCSKYKDRSSFQNILEGLDFLSNGEIFDTRFHHVGCDNWLWEQMDELSFATRAHLTNTKHNHFSRGGQMDAVYEKGWDKTQQDRDLLQALKETFKP